MKDKKLNEVFDNVSVTVVKEDSEEDSKSLLKTEETTDKGVTVTCQYDINGIHILIQQVNRLGLVSFKSRP